MMSMTKQLAAMVGVAVLLGLGARFVQKQPVPYWGFPKLIETIQPKTAFAGAESVAADSAFAAADKPYELELSAAMGLFMKRKKSNVYFIDARDPVLYAAGHIPGAVNIPYEKVAGYMDSLLKVSKDGLAVLYCENVNCHLSHQLAEYMLANGWKRLAVYSGGYDEWAAETDFIEAAK